MSDDPYAILNLPYSADATMIQKAFQEQMKLVKDQEALIEAYGMIRDPVSRERFRWNDHRFCEAKIENENNSIDIEALIKELAFLSPWEMGDDSCLN